MATEIQWSKSIRGWGITANNLATFTNVATEEQCQLLCLLEKSFVCRSIDYGKRGAKDCQLSFITKAEAGRDWEGKWTNYDYSEILPGPFFSLGHL